MNPLHPFSPPMTIDSLDSLFSTFSATMDALCSSDMPTRIAVAVSGGADSMAACLLAKEWASARGTSLLALTVDHGLRPESRVEAESVHTLLTSLGVTHKILTWEGEKPRARVQERAREARLALLTKECQNECIQHLILAHHRDDQDETRIMRLARGTTLLGLAGMSAVRENDGVCLLRPLLTTPKSALVAYLEETHVPWIEDPSNHKDIFTRVLVRRALGSGRLLHVVEDARLTSFRHLWEKHLIFLLDRLGGLENGAYAHIDLEAFRLLPDVWQEGLLARLIPMIGAGFYPVRRESIARILNKIASGKGFTGGGCLFRTKGKTLWIMREPSLIKDSSPLIKSQSVTWDRRFSYFGPSEPGTLEKLGESGVRLLKEMGIKINAPREAVEGLPALWQGERLVWTPGFIPHPVLDVGCKSLVTKRWHEVFVPSPLVAPRLHETPNPLAGAP
ncbi:MAG: tRNA lysidine(34) synthetase TilS [Candidatus Puniceispirillum sp.]|nr:tRNA lysidine(34) synthetase TilS [Candidatus Puniceispirillum sp.]